MLTSEDAQALKRAGLATAVRAGMRTVSQTMIDSTYESDTSSWQEYIKFYEQTENEQTLKWLGFDEITVKHLLPFSSV